MDSELTRQAKEVAPVLVVGGSLVGLSAAMFLGARGVPCVVVERHLGSSPHPRAIGLEPTLLDSYDEERRPVAWLRLRQTFARPDYAKYADDISRETPLLDPIAIELGELYRSKVVLGAGDDLPLARTPDAWRGQPGTRAPHRFVTRDDRQLSTLDFFGQNWTLVSSNPAWCAVAEEVRRAVSVNVTALDLRDALGASDRALVERDLGIGANGASLVRPDGIVAWRSNEGASADALRAALLAAACARPQV